MLSSFSFAAQYFFIIRLHSTIAPISINFSILLLFMRSPVDPDVLKHCPSVCSSVFNDTMISTRNKSDGDCLATKLMLLVLKIFGLAPYALRVNRQTSKSSRKMFWQNLPTIQFSSSRLGCIYNLCLVLAQTRMLFSSIPLEYSDRKLEELPINVMISVISCVFANSVLFAIWLILGFRQKTAVRLLNRLLCLDSAIFFPNESYRLESSGRFFCLVLLANIFVWTGLLLTQQLAFHPWVLTWFSVALPCTIITGFITEYIFVVKLIEKRFRALNEVLLDHFLPRLFIAADDGTHYSFPSKISEIRRVYANLYVVASEISEWWSLPILAPIAYNSYMLVCNSYYFISPFVIMRQMQTNLMIINSIFWLISEMMPIAILATGVNDVTAEMKKTADIIRKLLIRSSTSRKDKIELKQFAIELLHRKINFTACGFFPLDRTLVHSIFSMSATYLTILIQISMASSNNSST